MRSTTAPIPVESGPRTDEPLVELVIQVEALEGVVARLRANASLFAEGAAAYEAGIEDTIEAIRELAEG